MRNFLYVLNLCQNGCLEYVQRPERVNARRVRSRTAAEVICGLDVNQSLSQPPKCIQLMLHEAPELAKLQATSYVEVR